MDIPGEEHIAAPRQAVWDALNDIATLQRSIPGCEGIERLEDGRIRAAIKVRLGVITIRFHGILTLSDMIEPQSYTISGQGEGSIAGFAHGVTDVSLHENGDETILRYIIRGEAGGKIAQLGSKLLGSAARKIADRFFANIAQEAQNASQSQERSIG